METQESINYKRIAKAIRFIQDNFQEQPSLDAIAEQVNVSPYHFQRMFTEWAGMSPKRFLQYLSLEHAKKLLVKEHLPLLETAYETGFSSPSRMHDLFVNIEGMTPAEYRNGGKLLTINFSFAESPFGSMIVASTAKGVCYMAFEEDEDNALNGLRNKFPNAELVRKLDLLQQNALFIFQQDQGRLSQIKLHLKGTDFQLKVWESLLKIPMGRLSSYGRIAAEIKQPQALRAVGTAIGSNPVAYLIPCHRVIRSTGFLGDYMWGTERKAAIIGWESARMESLTVA